MQQCLPSAQGPKTASAITLSGSQGEGRIMSIGNEVMEESSKRSIPDGQKGLLLLIELFAKLIWNSYMNVCAMLAIKDDNDTPMIA